MAKKHAAPSPKRVMEAQALARELGWVSLNDEEIRLIKLLRFTTYHGRNTVMDVAVAMRQAHPWADDGSPQNTVPRTTPAFSLERTLQ